MFIKKDLRKIPAIVSDLQSPHADNDGGGKKKSSTLDLSRRQAEFGGSIAALTGRLPPSPSGALRDISTLNLYASGLTDLNSVEKLAVALPSLESVHIGGNPLGEIPDGFGALVHAGLLELWAEDCGLREIPRCLTDGGGVSALRVLRLTGNALCGDLGDGCAGCPVGSLPRSLQTLALDRNSVGPSVSAGIGSLTGLEVLHLRGNALEALPDVFCGMASLSVLHLSSNRLTALPSSLADCVSLTELYVNGNALVALPPGLERLKNLTIFCAQDNRIEELDEEFIGRFGRPEGEDGACRKDPEASVLLGGNPVATAVTKRTRDGAAVDGGDDNS